MRIVEIFIHLSLSLQNAKFQLSAAKLVCEKLVNCRNRSFSAAKARNRQKA